MLILEFLTAIAAGLLAGLTGGGGGMFFVPVLIFAGLPVVQALETSNLGILITSAAGTLTNARKGLVPWRRVILLGNPGGHRRAAGRMDRPAAARQAAHRRLYRHEHRQHRAHRS
jgi:uncharacterized membrane protein YfcA